MTRHGRAYRRLLRLYPAGFRHSYADEMTRLFEEQVRDARRAGGTAALMLLWLRSVTDLVATAAVTRLREVERVRQPVGPTAPDALPTPARPARGRTFVALTPIWVLLAVFVLRPRFLDPLFGNPPGIAGMPAGVMLLAAMILWTLLGAWVIRARRSELGTLLTLFVFAIPATFAVILGPALILIVQNLG